MKALCVFIVNYAGIRLKVRVLPSIKDVHREYQKGISIWHCIIRNHVVHAFFKPTLRSRKLTGVIVLPSDGNLDELIPHECVHAVMWGLGDKKTGEAKWVCCNDDEPLAMAVGILSSRIIRKIRRELE